ncbi:MAG TPA: zf-HC2 domain-containing protein [Vicinamibacteria bacterium]|nr:zf-HC2 domain-containing protein [Vicinamibacteria bacterium]
MSGHEGERLCAYLDGELPRGERAEVEAHLAACPACTALLADMTAVDAAAASLPAEAPEGYFDAFSSRVVARLGVASKSPARARRLPAWTWAAAAALLLAVVAPLTLRRPAPGLEPTTTQAPGPPGPAGEDLERERDALAAPDATPPQPAFASPPAAALPPASGGPVVAESRLPSAKASRNEAVSEASRVPPPPPAESEVRQEPAQVTTEGFAAAEGAPAPARRTPAVAAAPMASSARQDETAAGAVSVPESERAFARLEASRPRTAAEWRRLRDAWSAFAAAHPDDPRSDEARVRAIEAGREAWVAGGAGDDAAAFRRDARAYLEREDARQKERVERLLPLPPRQP